MGIYIGTPTYLLSPVEFAQNPLSLFLILSRYKIKDTYATPQMLDHAIGRNGWQGLHAARAQEYDDFGRQPATRRRVPEGAAALCRHGPRTAPPSTRCTRTC